MKIAIIVPSLAGGGVEKVAAELSSYLAKNNEVFFILFENKEIVYPFSGKIIRTNTPSKKNLFMKMINSLKRIRIVNKIKKRMSFDLTISFERNANLVNLISKKREKIIVSEHSIKITDSIYFKIYKWFYEHLYKKSDAIVVPSMGMKEMLMDNYKITGENISVINNPINEKRINHLISKNCNDNDVFSNKEDFYIISAGRLDFSKGYWHLIKAFSIVKKEIKNSKLLILGSGNQREDLVKLIESLDVDDVSFLGFRENPYYYFYNSNLFVASSIYESFSNVIIEAMACGLPVISTYCSGPKEILDPGSDLKTISEKIHLGSYGVFVPPFNSEEDVFAPISDSDKNLADAILFVMKNENIIKEYREKSIERSKDFYLDKIMKKWEKILSKAMKE